MIMGVNATLGVFLILAAEDLLKQTSLIWFTSFVRDGIMAIQAIADSTECMNLLGDTAALF